MSLRALVLRKSEPFKDLFENRAVFGPKFRGITSENRRQDIRLKFGGRVGTGLVRQAICPELAGAMGLSRPPTDQAANANANRENVFSPNGESPSPVCSSEQEDG
jgi:hypothetical protein